MPDVDFSSTVTKVVEPADCASRWGNDGLNVLSTPAILGNMEQACVDALQAHLAPGEMTVGVKVEMHHRAPTPLGAEVEYRISVRGDHPKFEVDFSVVDSAGTVVCEGKHRRAAVRVAAFVAKLEEVGRPARTA
ncbi:thioesterase family protein [Amycolatopsis samaneae]|uniref:Thioesterase family protein n=1 Tax=Amycolatopsis samaneae TaxID=664691 RepID=A0ABW5GTA7_9PSEU